MLVKFKDHLLNCDHIESVSFVYNGVDIIFSSGFEKVYPFDKQSDALEFVARIEKEMTDKEAYYMRRRKK